MKNRIPLFCGVAFILVILSASRAFTQPEPGRHPKVVPLNKVENGIQPVLNGPPETATMKSGYVVLNPGHSVGKHSTEHNEEMLVVLEGTGEMLFRDGSKLDLEGRTAVYCPPETEHDVKNTGTTPLRYVYIVARAE